MDVLLMGGGVAGASGEAAFGALPVCALHLVMMTSATLTSSA
jgi:hypothetical protein